MHSICCFFWIETALLQCPMDQHVFSSFPFLLKYSEFPMIFEVECLFRTRSSQVQFRKTVLARVCHPFVHALFLYKINAQALKQFADTQSNATSKQSTASRRTQGCGNKAAWECCHTPSAYHLGCAAGGASQNE